MQKELAVKEVELTEKNARAEELIKVVGKEQLKVADEKQFGLYSVFSLRHKLSIHIHTQVIGSNQILSY